MRLIDADALKKAFEDCTGDCACCIHNTNDFEYCGLIDDTQTVENPTIYEFKGCDNCELERPKGEWITNREYIDKEFNGHYEGSCFNSPYNCNCCGYSPKDNRPNFCPNCGADMRSENKFNDLVVFDDQPKRQLETPDCHNEL